MLPFSRLNLWMIAQLMTSQTQIVPSSEADKRHVLLEVNTVMAPLHGWQEFKPIILNLIIWNIEGGCSLILTLNGSILKQDIWNIQTPKQIYVDMKSCHQYNIEKWEASSTICLPVSIQFKWLAYCDNGRTFFQINNNKLVDKYSSIFCTTKQEPFSLVKSDGSYCQSIKLSLHEPSLDKVPKLW